MYNKVTLLAQAREYTDHLLMQYHEYKEVSHALHEAYSDETKSILKERLNQISDAMTFANPIVWLMYKRDAYQGTPRAISSLGDLKSHVDHPEDICYKRYDFFTKELLKHKVNLKDTGVFPDTMELGELLEQDAIYTVFQDETFLPTWEEYEYNRIEGKVAKWQNYLPQ